MKKIMIFAVFMFILVQSLQFVASVGTCSGRCESGKECNQYGNPSEGKMWSCWKVGTSYTCVEDPINSGGSSCYLRCSPYGWASCGCDISGCEARCRADNAGSPGHHTRTELCDTCQQKFTCGCDIPYPYCGDGIVNQPTEQCEPRSSSNNLYCPQNATVCSGNLLGTRDYYGNCNSDCGCAPDTFSYTCVPGQCGACPNNCDDANPNTVDTCDLVTCTCKHITQSFCGDGICNDGAGKTCDPDGTSMDVSCINVGGKLTEGVCRKTGTNACTYCGDGIVQSGDLEGCDLGDQNGVPGSSCASDCRPIELPVCGDSICNDGPGKTCELNGPAYDFKCPGGPQFRLNEGVCRSSGSNACTYCGDSIVQNNGLEECDLGDQNGIPGSGCTSECLTEPIIPEFSVFTLLLTIIISLFVFRFWII